MGFYLILQQTHILLGTVVDIGTKYSTISDDSDIINTKNGFFRVNITSMNLRNALEFSPFIDTDISNWSLDFIGIPV